MGTTLYVTLGLAVIVLVQAAVALASPQIVTTSRYRFPLCSSQEDCNADECCVADFLSTPTKRGVSSFWKRRDGSSDDFPLAAKRERGMSSFWKRGRWQSQGACLPKRAEGQSCGGVLSCPCNGGLYCFTAHERSLAIRGICKRNGQKAGFPDFFES
ncbi:uncharacterized protein LOC135494759 [Lineus longissimus]|uniref:uncharacterized protein LOC135494759 n=1 Tax=Lineus longissimus TaxID=88925 RepID=UPI00315D1A1D